MKFSKFNELNEAELIVQNSYYRVLFSGTSREIKALEKAGKKLSTPYQDKTRDSISFLVWADNEKYAKKQAQVIAKEAFVVLEEMTVEIKHEINEAVGGNLPFLKTKEVIKFVINQSGTDIGPDSEVTKLRIKNKDFKTANRLINAEAKKMFSEFLNRRLHVVVTVDFGGKETEVGAINRYGSDRNWNGLVLSDDSWRPGSKIRWIRQDNLRTGDVFSTLADTANVDEFNVYIIGIDKKRVEINQERRLNSMIKDKNFVDKGWNGQQPLISGKRLKKVLMSLAAEQGGKGVLRDFEVHIDKIKSDVLGGGEPDSFSYRKEMKLLATLIEKASNFNNTQKKIAELSDNKKYDIEKVKSMIKSLKRGSYAY